MSVLQIAPHDLTHVGDYLQITLAEIRHNKTFLMSGFRYFQHFLEHRDPYFLVFGFKFLLVYFTGCGCASGCYFRSRTMQNPVGL